MQHDGAGRTEASTSRGRFAGSLRGRLLLAGLAVIAPLIVGAGLWIVLLSHSARDYRHLAREAASESEGSVVLLQHLNEAEEAGIEYAEMRRAGDLREFKRIAAQIDRELADTRRYDRSAEVASFVSIKRPWRL